MNVNQDDLYEENQRLREENISLKKAFESNTYKLLFESSPDIIVQVDKNHNILILHLPNHPIERLEAIRGRNIFEVTPLHAHVLMKNALDKVFSTGEVVNYESEGESLGTYRYFDNHLSAIKNEQGEIFSAYFVSRDITKQKLSDKFNLESERKLHALFQNSHHILTLLDVDCKIIWFNKKADEHHTRLGKPMVVGINAEEYFQGERLEAFKQNVRRALDGEIITYTRQFVAEGKPYYLEICLQPVYQEETLIGISLASSDITESYQYEEKLKKINSELVQQNEQLNQYSYIISHNLRAPIVTLLGLVTIFDQTKNDKKETEAIIGHIQKSAHHLDTVIKDLNQVLSITDKKALITPVHLDDEFDIVQFLLKDQIEEAQAIIELDFSKHPILKTVKSYIHNIFFNLLSNALKYKKEHKAPTIRVSSYKHETGFICIEFTDDGIGVDLEKFQDKLFGFYKRFHTHVEGKGLGLHLIKKQIDILEGKIEVESVVNYGTTFRVLLPE